MSKSPNLFLPALGGAALILGAGYGIATKQYADSRIVSMESTVAAAQAEAAKAAQMADAEVAKAAELEAKAIEIQNEAQARLAMAGGGAASEPAPVRATGYGLGRAALPEEIAGWDVNVMPDGTGLPVGKGDVATGEEVFSANCASCHGEFAEGLDNWPKLAGGDGTLADKDPVKTVGSYWPYLSTVWDYVHRSMPFGQAQTMSVDDTYAIVAYILYSNDIVDEDFELSNENFTEVVMPNADGFIVDDRAETEYPIWSGEPCMENCKESVEITMRATVLDVTPEHGSGDQAAAEPAAVEPAATETAATEPAQETPVAETQTAAADPALIEEGAKVFKKCQACHAVGAGAKNRTGPELNGILGRTIGGHDGYKYSTAFQEAAADGQVWDEAHLTEFLMNPKGVLQGTKMTFAGLKTSEEAAAVIAYIQSESAE
jgi:cytochrome c